MAYECDAPVVSPRPKPEMLFLMSDNSFCLSASILSWYAFFQIPFVPFYKAAPWSPGNYAPPPDRIYDVIHKDTLSGPLLQILFSVRSHTEYDALPCTAADNLPAGLRIDNTCPFPSLKCSSYVFSSFSSFLFLGMPYHCNLYSFQVYDFLSPVLPAALGNSKFFL